MNSVEKWSLEIIRLGVKKFFDENGRYPSARDFDKCKYLPTARTIQRNFGGMSIVRGSISPESSKDFRTGTVRSNVSKNNIIRAYKEEEDFYRFLITKFPEVQVHEQKRLRPGNIASDFFIYTTPIKGFAIDIFHSSDRFNTFGILNIKLKRYVGLAMPIIFVVIGDFSQDDVDSLLGSKKNKLDKNMYFYADNYFKSNLDAIIKSLNL